MKTRYQVLDGLRGTAALGVVAFHLWELMVPGLDYNPMPHTFLAVDFFFTLSGFVLGYAYDGRLARGADPRMALGFWDFIKRRLIRLHPVVIVAASIGLATYLLDPNVGTKQTVGVALSADKLMLIFALSLFLLPAPPLPNDFGETHAINPPSWTLFWEYVANLFFVSYGHRMKRPLHIAIMVAGAAGLLLTAHFYKGDLGYGWGWDNVWVAPIRLIYPFLAGLLVYRLGWKIKMPAPYLTASLILLAVFLAPRMGWYNGVFEAACVIFVFPLVVMIGASVDTITGPLAPLCRFAGAVSYPLYIVHYPFTYMFGHWDWSTHPDKPHLYAVAVGVFAFQLGLGTLLLYAYDRPVRAWLSKRYLKP